MKNLLMILLFLASTSVFAQKVTVTGTVTEEKGNPLPGTTVQVKGTTVGTTTGADGKYSVELPGPNLTLVFSFIGYIAKEVPVLNQTTINILLILRLPGFRRLLW